MISHDELRLQELNAANFYAICQLSVKQEQEGYVDTNAISMAEANFSDYVWMRGIYLNEAPVGFVMIDARPEENTFYLWRFMIDGDYQGAGLGRSAIQLIVNELKATFNAKELTTSVVPDNGGPQQFYESVGFKLTGNYIEDRELELKLSI
ncbi:GNAT family N-acetyltransferase [Photobacterium kagoshimensis]|uniref:GNAT family N-acetyltransferase n=1 Tax=Photobacterium kagoshimensis TaxID=2910242 RepID=UPI003D0C5ADD